MFLDDIAFIDEYTHNKQIATEIKNGDVLLNITGASIGRCCVATNEVIGGNVNQHVCIIRPKQDLLSSYYLCCLILSDKGQKQIDSFQAGGNRQGLNFEQIKSFQFSLPKLPEQKKVAQLLTMIDERISIQNKVFEDLKKLKAAIEDECFNQLEGKPVRLADILDERIEKSERNNQYQVLSSTVSGLYSQRDYFNKDIASSDNTGYKIIRRGDIVLSPQNLWMGNINYNNKFDIGIVSPSYKVFSIKPLYNRRFVASLLKTKKALWEYSLVSEQGASIVRRNLSMNSFMDIAFPIPNKEVQEKIGDAITNINRRIKLENEYLASINRQKCYLLNSLFI